MGTKIETIRCQREADAAARTIARRCSVPQSRARPRIKHPRIKHTGPTVLRKEVTLWREVLWILHSIIPNVCKRPTGYVNLNQSKAALDGLLTIARNAVRNVDRQSSAICESVAVAEQTLSNAFDFAH